MEIQGEKEEAADHRHHQDDCSDDCHEDVDDDGDNTKADFGGEWI